MEQFQHIDVQGAQQLLEQHNAVLVDTRDAQAFMAGHAYSAFHLTNETLNTLMADVDWEQPILVMCYRGISSQGVAQYLIHQGYEQVYSVDGGFAAWQQANLPIEQA